MNHLFSFRLYKTVPTSVYEIEEDGKSLSPGGGECKKIGKVPAGPFPIARLYNRLPIDAH
jgi:hypothetical protein